MQQVVTTLDDYGRPAWIIATVLGFTIWWPIGLGSGLSDLEWTHGLRKQTTVEAAFRQEAKRFGGGFGGFGPLRTPGTLPSTPIARRLCGALKRRLTSSRLSSTELREARDKADLDQFMAQRGQGPKPASA